MSKDDPKHPVHDPKYKDIDSALLPSSENMSDVLKRVRVLY
jgi:2,3-bisphosphoglycerate-dependent phosphoglycerate mutase